MEESEELETPERIKAKSIFPFVLCVDNSTSMQQYFPTLKDYLSRLIKFLKNEVYRGMESTNISVISFNREASEPTELIPIREFKNLSITNSTEPLSIISRAIFKAILVCDKAKVEAYRNECPYYYRPFILVLTSGFDDDISDIHTLNKITFEYGSCSENKADPSILIIDLANKPDSFNKITKFRVVNVYSGNEIEQVILNSIESIHMVDSASDYTINLRERCDLEKTSQIEDLLVQEDVLKYESKERIRDEIDRYKKVESGEIETVNNENWDYFLEGFPMDDDSIEKEESDEDETTNVG